MTNTDKTATLALISKLVARQARVREVLCWLNPDAPGYDKLARSLHCELSGIRGSLALCAEDMVADAADDAPNLSCARQHVEGEAPWYAAATVADVLAMQAASAKDWIADLVAEQN